MFPNALPLLINQAVAEHQIEHEHGRASMAAFYAEAFDEIVAELKRRISPAEARERFPYAERRRVMKAYQRALAKQLPDGDPIELRFGGALIAWALIAVGDPEHTYSCREHGIRNGFVVFRFAQEPLDA